MRPFRQIVGASLVLAAGVASAQVIECASACTVTINHSFDTLTPEKVEDYMALFAAFILAAAVVLGAKAIYQRFRVDYEH